MCVVAFFLCAQSENAALSRDKKKLEAELAEARSKVKHLEGTVAKKDAEVWSTRSLHAIMHYHCQSKIKAWRVCV